MRGVIGQTVASGEVLSARIFVIGGVFLVMRGVIGQTVASGEVLSARLFIIGGVFLVRLFGNEGCYRSDCC